MEDQQQVEGRGPESEAERAARRANEPGERGRGRETDEERAARGLPPRGEDDEAEDEEETEEAEPDDGPTPAAPV